MNTLIHHLRLVGQAAGKSWLDAARQWWSWSLVFLGLFTATSLPAATITRTSSPVFYIDTSVTPTLQAMYVAYQIRNIGGTTYPDVWVSISDFNGASISLGPFEDGLVHLGSISPGQTKTAFFYLQAAIATLTPQSHTVTVYPTRPPAGAMASQTFSMTVEESIQANANQVTTVVAGPNPPQVGGLVTVTVTGQSGTIGDTGEIALNPAAYLSWRPDAYELVQTSVTLSGGNGGNYTDTLYLTVAGSAATDYTAVYTYRTIASTITPTPVSPISFISSGQQIKHTRVNNFSQFEAIQPANNYLTLGKSVTPAQAQGGALVTFSLTLTNGGSLPVIVEDFVDTLPTWPAPLSYVSGSSRYQGALIPDPTVLGAELTWVGTFNVAIGSIGTLTFQAQLPLVNGSFTNAAVSHIGSSQIDTTPDTLDNAPATAVVQAGVLAVSGRVFLDTGLGGGTAHDGLLNGAELGLASITLRLTDVTGATVYGTTTTDASGAYALTIPASISPGTAIRLQEINPPNHVSVSADTGNSGGTYDPALDAIVFPFVAGVTWTNLNFGDVPISRFEAPGQQTGVPGGIAVYAHIFTAGSSGQVDFTVTNTANPDLPGWTQVWYLDANCDSQLDVNDPIWTGPFSLAAGETVCLLIKESIPLNAPVNAADAITVTAYFDHVGANPAVITEHPLMDLTTVGGPGSAGLTLVKSADKNEAKPGEAITYTIIYANTSTQPLQNMTLHDVTPVFTTFLNATNGPLAPNLSGVTMTLPAVGTAGPVSWSFQGTLASGQRGFVQFQVLIQQ